MGLQWEVAVGEEPGIAGMVMFGMEVFQLFVREGWDFQRVAAGFVPVGVVGEEFVYQATTVDFTLA